MIRNLYILLKMFGMVTVFVPCDVRRGDTARNSIALKLSIATSHVIYCHSRFQ